jgi:hypothetical protein
MTKPLYLAALHFHIEVHQFDEETFRSSLFGQFIPFSYRLSQNHADYPRNFIDSATICTFAASKRKTEKINCKKDEKDCF